jgi:hypothetical protein
MKFRSSILAIAAMTIAAPAFGQTKAPPLTVQDVIGVWNAINALDTHQTGVLDKTGNPIAVPNNYEYSGAVHLTLARDNAKAYMIVKDYNDELAKMRAKFTEDQKDVPKEKLAEFTQERQKEFDKKSAEMLMAPATDVTFVHIKSTDLCLDAHPPECPVKNAIPITVIQALLPILD